MKRAAFYVIGSLVVAIVILSAAVGVFLAPFFQADLMLANLVIDEVVSDTCYLVSLEVMPDNDPDKREPLLQRASICGDFLGMGYEFALPNKSFAIMQKPGIVITNVVAFDKKTRDQTGNLPVGGYKFEFAEKLRAGISEVLRNTPMFKSITYDIKAVMQKPKKGAVIAYTLEPLRQQVIATCTGCAK